MTSQIVEEQTYFVEEQIVKLKGEQKDYPYTFVTDKDLRSFASTLIERSVKKSIEVFKHKVINVPVGSGGPLVVSEALLEKLILDSLGEKI